MTKSRGIRAPKRPWTESEVELLRRDYPNVRTQEIAIALDRPLVNVYAKAGNMGLHKSEAFAVSDKSGRIFKGGKLGQQTQFQAGLTPWNKGTNYVAGGRSDETRFKKGRLAHEARNYVPIGSYRHSKDGYLERKVTDDSALVPARRWVAVHRLVWIEANGPVPAGHVVAFLPGRRANVLELITLDALELVSRRDLMKRNTFHQYGPDIVKVVQLRGALTRQINRRIKQEETQ